jgi:hypothetical protein
MIEADHSMMLHRRFVQKATEELRDYWTEVKDNEQRQKLTRYKKPKTLLLSIK